MRKILIFYASYGGGHLSAANSIKQYIDEHYSDCETNLVDCMLYVNKPINRIRHPTFTQIKAVLSFFKNCFCSKGLPLFFLGYPKPVYLLFVLSAIQHPE